MKTTEIAFIIGCFAFIFFGIGLIQKKKEKTLVLQTIANIIYAIQYLLLNAYEAVIMNVINIIRGLIFHKNEKNNKKTPIIVLILFIIIPLGIGIYLYDGILSLIPAFITIIYSVATYQNNMKVLRYMFLFTACVWIVFNVEVKAYSAVIGNIFEIGFGITGLIINRKKSK